MRRIGVPNLTNERQPNHMTITITKFRLAIGVVAVALLGATTALAVDDNPFTDVPDSESADAAFYSGPVEWLWDNSLTTGSPSGSTTFKPLDNVTRGEYATFNFRYDENVVQPALTTLQGEIDAAEASVASAQADADANAAAIAAIESAKSPIVLSYGPGSWVNNGAFGVGTFGSSSAGLDVTGPGFINLDLNGPVSQGDTQYQLSSIEYCIRAIGAGTLVENAWIFGYTETGAMNAVDATDRTAAGCYTVTPTGDIEESDALTFALDFTGGGSVQIGGTTATWVTEATLAALGDGQTQSFDGVPEED